MAKERAEPIARAILEYIKLGQTPKRYPPRIPVASPGTGANSTWSTCRTMNMSGARKPKDRMVSLALLPFAMTSSIRKRVLVSRLSPQKIWRRRPEATSSRNEHQKRILAFCLFMAPI
jgi:hypothetical protein